MGHRALSAKQNHANEMNHSNYDSSKVRDIQEGEKCMKRILKEALIFAPARLNKSSLPQGCDPSFCSLQHSSLQHQGHDGHQPHLLSIQSDLTIPSFILWLPLHALRSSLLDTRNNLL